MKVIIAGSRSIEDYEFVKKCIKESGFYITEIISGGAFGVDTLAKVYANENDIPFTEMKPDYIRYDSKYAPLYRNIRMANYGEGLIAIWDGVSRGTKHMINQAKKKSLQIKVFNTQ